MNIIIATHQSNYVNNVTCPIMLKDTSVSSTSGPAPLPNPSSSSTSLFWTSLIIYFEHFWTSLPISSSRSLLIFTSSLRNLLPATLPKGKELPDCPCQTQSQGNIKAMDDHGDTCLAWKALRDCPPCPPCLKPNPPWPSCCRTWCGAFKVKSSEDQQDWWKVLVWSQLTQLIVQKTV